MKELKPGEHLLTRDIRTLSMGLQKEMRKYLNQARLALETGILTVAAEVVTEEGGARIRQAQANYEAGLRSDPADVDWAVHDRLHLAFAEATGNDILVDMLQRLIELVPYSLRDINAPHADPQQMKEFHGVWRIIHGKLCAAVLGGDAQSACEWMRRHSEYESINIERDYGHFSLPAPTKSTKIASGGWPSMKKLEIPTPALVVDIDKLKYNIEDMAGRARQAGMALRPHIKTHKTPVITHMQLKAGATGIVCAKLGEAEVMAAAGVDNILVCYPIVGPDRIERLLNLACWVPRVSTTVDTRAAAQALSDAAAARNQCVDVLVEVDVGYKRTGIAPGEPLLDQSGALSNRCQACATRA